MPRKTYTAKPIPCLYCQRPFEPARKDAQFCSGKCRQAADRARRAAAAKTPAYRNRYNPGAVFAAGMTADEAALADFRVVALLGPSTAPPPKRIRDRDARWAAERLYWSTPVSRPTSVTPSPAAGAASWADGERALAWQLHENQGYPYPLHDRAAYLEACAAKGVTFPPRITEARCDVGPRPGRRYADGGRIFDEDRTPVLLTAVEGRVAIVPYGLRYGFRRAPRRRRG